jgi:hypothetical protein
MTLKGQNGKMRVWCISLGPNEEQLLVFKFFWSALEFLWIFKVLISLNKTGSLLDGPSSLLDTKLESGEEQLYAFI